MLIEWLNADTTCSQESLYSLHQLLIAKVNIKIRGMMEGQMIRLQYCMDFFLTRTTNVVRNAGCARSRYTQIFFNQLMNQLTEYI